MFATRVRAAPCRGGMVADAHGDATRTTTTATTRAAAHGDAADVLIVGKRYPTSAYGRMLARHAELVAFVVFVPLVFACIGVVGFLYYPSYALADFGLADGVAMHAAAQQQAARLDAWTRELSGEAALRARVDTRQPRTRIMDTIELRYALRDASPDVAQRYENNTRSEDGDDTTGPLHDLLDRENQHFVHVVEHALVSLPSYAAVCFTNDLIGSDQARPQPSSSWPVCVPPVSVQQYFFPSYDNNSNNNNNNSDDNTAGGGVSTPWRMDGRGDVFQYNVVPRMLVNPNYGWFVDATFSAFARTARVLRTQLVLAASHDDDDGNDSDGASLLEYTRRADEYITEVLRYVTRSVRHPYIDLYIGGDAVERVRVLLQLTRERYKVVVVFVVCAVVAYVYTRSAFVAVYAAAQVLATYLATCGVYVLVYHTVPIMAYAAVMWVATLTLHGSLSFYGVFVQSGQAATHGRGNDLSVEQRVSLTLRRCSVAVCLADALAMLVFAVNTSSAFVSVYTFSVFMIIACAWNVLAAAVVTPAFVVLHHRRFSGARRDLQKQTDVRNAARQQCRRPAAMARVLAAVQRHLARGDVMYVHDDDVLRARIGERSGVNKRHYRTLRDWAAAQRATLHEAALTARYGVVGAAHKMDKTTAQLIAHLPFAASRAPDDDNDSNNHHNHNDDSDARSGGALAFVLEEFAELSRANPLGNNNNNNNDSASPQMERAGVAAMAMRPRYFNRRLVREDDVVHVPALYTSRSAACWNALAHALEDDNDSSNDNSAMTRHGPPRVASLSREVHDGRRGDRRLHHDDDDDDDDDDDEETTAVTASATAAAATTRSRLAAVQAFGQRWSGVGRRLGLDVGDGLESRPLFALRARAVVRAHDPDHVICVREGDDSDDDDDDDGDSDRRREKTTTRRAPTAATGTTTPRDIESSGWSLRKLYCRLTQRRVRRRRYLFGLCGPLRDETPAMRRRRLLTRRVRREGDDGVTRLLTRVYVPALVRARWALLVAFVLLSALLIALGARLTTAAPPPPTLRDDAATRQLAAAFARLDGGFGQRGSCTFCGPYYRHVSEYRTATAADVAACARGDNNNNNSNNNNNEQTTASLRMQMNVYADACGVCNGTSACVDCAGVVHGPSRRTACGGCTLPNATQCTCNDTHECAYCTWAQRPSPATPCVQPSTCAAASCGAHGHCNVYTDVCTCDADYTGKRCRVLAPWAALSHAQRTNDASHVATTTTTAQAGTRSNDGDDDDDDDVVCVHGYVPYGERVCRCEANWTGPRCDASVQCGGRGVWLRANESPTGAAMCACNGHWRGRTCQLCDCVNGGMCDAVTGQCHCVGAYVGPRCASCSASCVQHGTCPRTPPPPSSWNVRACVAAACSAADVEAEVVCDACAAALPTPREAGDDDAVSSTTLCARHASDKRACQLLPECWWVGPTNDTASGTTTTTPRERAVGCVAAQAMSPLPPSAVSCTCRAPEVWSGTRCDVCRAPAGGVCTYDDKIRACNGLEYASPRFAVARDACGVCGGDGACRGCDGVPLSGKVVDACGVCGGDGNCTRRSESSESSNSDSDSDRGSLHDDGQPVYVNFMVDLRDAPQPARARAWTAALTSFCQTARQRLPSVVTPQRCVYEDYVDYARTRARSSSRSNDDNDDNDDGYVLVDELYEFARQNARLSEIGFVMDDVPGSVVDDSRGSHTRRPRRVSFMSYRLRSNATTRTLSADAAYALAHALHDSVVVATRPTLAAVGATASVTSSVFEPAAAQVLATRSLWFVVVVGVVFAFATLLVYFVSLCAAALGALLVTSVCFGVLTICAAHRAAWRMDAVMLTCVTCTLPVALEYAVHLLSGYYDALQTSTSHLFARTATRQAAVRGMVCRVMPPLCTTVAAVVLSAVAFATSPLLPLRRSGQVCIMLHLTLLVMVTLFTSALAAAGPVTLYQHWLLSVLLAALCGVGVGVVLAVIYGTGGVLAPNDQRILA